MQDGGDKKKVVGSYSLAATPAGKQGGIFGIYHSRLFRVLPGLWTLCLIAGADHKTLNAKLGFASKYIPRPSERFASCESLFWGEGKKSERRFRAAAIQNSSPAKTSFPPSPFGSFPSRSETLLFHTGSEIPKITRPVKTEVWLERHDLCPADYPRSGAGEKPSDRNRGRSTPLPSAASTSQSPPKPQVSRPPKSVYHVL